ncbi:MAG: hypothetical protein IPJ88_07580 [Myxococcales bacterium]|nr:MAG: hypothetical protein IPJ88_07580 [Myxococcales bacterium]
MKQSLQKHWDVLLASRRVRVAGVLALSVAFLYLLVGLSAGYFVKNKIASEVKERFGLDVQSATARLGFSGVELFGFSAFDREHHALLFRAKKLKISVNPFLVPFRGSKAVRGIKLKDAVVEVDLASSGVERLFSRKGEKTKKKKARQQSEGLFFLVDGLELILHDKQGLLFRAQVADLEKKNTKMTGVLPLIVMGEGEEKETIELKNVSFSFSRNDGHYQLQNLLVDSIEFSWRPAEQQLRTRLREAQKAIGRDQRESTQKRNGSPEAEFGALDWFKKDVKAKVKSLTVYSQKGRLLNSGSVSLTGKGKGRFRFFGKGDVIDEGALSWDLSLQPKAMRGEGEVKLLQVPLTLLAPLLPDLPWYKGDDSAIDADLTLRAKGSDRILISGTMHGKELGLFSPRIGDDPVVVPDVYVEGEGSWWPLEKRLDIEKAELRIQEAVATLSGTLLRDSDYFVVDLASTVPVLPCNSVLGAVPSGLLEGFSGFSWTGTWGADLLVTVDSRDFSQTKFKLKAIDRCRFSTVPLLPI